MITEEILRANSATAELSAEQVAAIVELSRNDEAAVIGQKTGEIYGGLDADILASSGIAKNGTEKTYEYTKRVIGEIKARADELPAKQAEIDRQAKEIARLEKTIADGVGDAETKKELAKVKADLASVTKEYTDLKAKHDIAEEEHEKALFSLRLDGEFAGAVAGLKFKPDLPKSVTEVLTRTAVEKVKGYNPEYIDNGEGGKVLAFMDNGSPLRNKENGLRPYTAAELVHKELLEMGVLDTGRRQRGAGSEVGGGNGEDLSADISGAKSQTEAHDLIHKSLLAGGLAVGTRAYQEAMDKAWRDNEAVLKKLPM